MNKGKGKTPNKGVGFGNALFAIKNVQVDYEMFNQGPVVPVPNPKPGPPPTKKNPINVNPQKKPPNNIKPESVKPAIFQQKQ